MDNTSRDVAPGASAIATTLAKLYGYGAQPVHWGTPDSMRDGGDDPLEGVSAFDAGDHWHYVSYGLSQLKEDDRAVAVAPRVSGYGFELTFRLRVRPGESSPPEWPVMMMQRLAKYVFRSSNTFRSGDHMHLNAPMGGQRNTRIEGVLFASDVELQPTESVFGEVHFIQIFGVTDDELDAVKDWRCESFLDLVQIQNPKLVTDLSRPSMLGDSGFARACDAGAREHGSSHGSSFASLVKFEQGDSGMELTIGAIAVADLQRMLRLRLPYNRPFKLHGRRATVRFVPALNGNWELSGRELHIGVPWDSAAGMYEILQPERGRYEWPGISGLTLVVTPTDVRGPAGELVKVIG